MKKSLILASLLAFAVSTQCFAAETPTVESAKKTECVERPAPPDMQRPPKKPDIKKGEFEKRLKLTDEQKAKAKEIRKKGHEEMKPVMEQIKAKHKEIEAVKLSKIAEQAQKEQIDKLNAEIRDLRKQAHDLRLKNMKEFESILTKKQLKELKKMKEEGRKKFENDFRKQHGNSLKPPFGPPPEFGHGPAVPPPPPADAE